MEYLCSNCPRHCNVLRTKTGNGFCHMGADAVIARAALHYDEEPVISGDRGSGTIFFAGCSLQCRFCQNYSISHDGFGKRVSVEGLKYIYAELIAQGANNINLVNPTHFIEPIFKSLEEGISVPVVWNTGGYESLDTMRRLDGHVQIYLPDLKYRWADAAGRYSGAKDYFEYASKAICEMYRQVGSVRLNKEGIMESGMIVRHLILPGCAKESKAVLDWIAEHLPGAWVSLMAQYVPMGDVRGVDALERRVTAKEYDSVLNHMLALGLEDGFVQELSSSEEKYTPNFDLTGVPDCFT